MDIKLNHKMIKDLCGTVSFKRGDAFYHADKVKFENYSHQRVDASVSGADEFNVTVIKNEDGGFVTACTCPKLASVKNECQHTAAVLLAIMDQQKQLPTTAPYNKDSSNGLADSMMSIFSEQPRRSSGHQLHFESRKVLNAEFLLKPTEVGDKQSVFGISMKIGSIPIKDISGFLKDVKEGKANALSRLFTYDPMLHCFQNEADDIIQKLIQVAMDSDSLPNGLESNDENLTIPPTIWTQLLPLLTKAPHIKLLHNGELFDGLIINKGKLPLTFNFEVTEQKDYRLEIKGLKQLTVMNSYDSVLYSGQVTQLETADCARLFELKQMILATATEQIPITKDQIGFFVEKVVPGLRRLGEVQINGDISKQFMKTPLTAKLYLDRVNNRLLAGLEFHYENIVLNPFEGREPKTGSLLVRDKEKEDLILEMMEESSFAKTEGGYLLHNEDLEYEFLYHMMPKLQKLVQIYATTAVRNRIFREPARPQIRVKVKKERTNWLEFKFEMDSIPESQIREVLEALEEKRKYFRLRNGSLMSLETREFEEIQRFLQAGPIQNEDLEKGLNLPLIRGMQVLDSVDDQAVFMLEESFKEFLAEISRPGSKKFKLPETLDLILRDYQKQGFQWMKTLASYGFGGILADDMGLGKTLQSIAYIAS
ncbi:MAG: SNF2 helicase associated domain-containing protein, partial [Mesobacillus sp.]|uniref:SNF2 helicase associated domain-containing protein n=1 Tax=Mesobacillus sp. TaxID=2675271 RepID=UPI003C42816C